MSFFSSSKTRSSGPNGNDWPRNADGRRNLSINVSKIGGGEAIDAAAYGRFADDLAELYEGWDAVPGRPRGNAEFSKMSAALGMPPRMITSDGAESAATPTARRSTRC